MATVQRWCAMLRSLGSNTFRALTFAAVAGLAAQTGHSPAVGFSEGIAQAFATGGLGSRPYVTSDYFKNGRPVIFISYGRPVITAEKSAFINTNTETIGVYFT